MLKVTQPKNWGQGHVTSIRLTGIHREDFLQYIMGAGMKGVDKYT